MVSQGKLLGEVQHRAHLEVDKIYAPLSREVEQTILRHATPDARGVLRLSLPSRAAILTAIGTLIDNARLVLMRAIVGSVRAAEDAALVGATGIGRDLTASLTVYGTVWRALGTDRPSVIAQTGALLVRGIASEKPAREIAGTIRQFFSPFFAPRRDETGKLLRADREGAIRNWPGRAGMASAHARTIMLTETTAAHGRMQLLIARTLGQYVRYRVSAAHSKADECDQLARADSGYGPGIYPPGDAPRVPRHPRCRCYLSRVDRPTAQAA